MIRIFCDACNAVLPATPAKEVASVGFPKKSPEFGDAIKPEPFTAKVTVSNDLCDECKERLLKTLVSSKAFEESKIVRFGGNK